MSRNSDVINRHVRRQVVLSGEEDNAPAPREVEDPLLNMEGDTAAKPSAEHE